MTEAEIENAVVNYFRSNGYRCLPDKSIKWRKFVIFDGKEWEPDVVAFKWDNELTLDIRAAECKETGTYSSVMSARDQALIYKKHFPWCYIATKEPDELIN
jgi:hypothetical protein